MTLGGTVSHGKEAGESEGCGMDEVEGAELRETGRLIRGGACTCPAVVTE